MESCYVIGPDMFSLPPSTFTHIHITAVFCFSQAEILCFFSGLESGRHLVEISPLGCSGGSKTLSVKFSV